MCPFNSGTQRIRETEIQTMADASKVYIKKKSENLFAEIAGEWFDAGVCVHVPLQVLMLFKPKTTG